jgi:hypothetical protein
MLADHPQRLEALGCFANDLHALDAFEERADAGSHQGVVIGEENAQRAHKHLSEVMPTTGRDG